MNEKWFALSIEQIEKKLKTNAASGLSRKAARSRVDRGAGSVFYLPRRSPLSLLAEILSDFSLILLLLAAVLSLFFEEFRSGWVVLLLTLGNLLAVWGLYYRTRRLSETLATCFYPTVKVIRNGKLFHIDFRALAVGDVILVEEGDVICCDARLITSDRLAVKMRVDRERFLSLKKTAEGPVRPNEHRASELFNMIHAGSEVVSGSGRAIVTAVGKYTYLGAMTGGIPLPFRDGLPASLGHLQKTFSKFNLVFLLAILPFCLLSLLFSHLDGGTVLLSNAFLTALALAATTVSRLSFVLFRLFYAHRARELLYAPHPAVFRSAEAFEVWKDTDYLFLLDGCVLSDGVLHFGEAICADGELRNYENMSGTAKTLCELVSLYHTAATKTLTTGISTAGEYLSAIREFLRQSGVDEGALQIRCSVSSYIPANLEHAEELVCFTDRGVPYTLHISCSPEALGACRVAMLGGSKQILSDEGRARLERLWAHYKSTNGTAVLFSLSEGSMTTDNACFVGILVLREGVDPNLGRNWSRLEKQGCRIVTFDRPLRNAPAIPKELLAGRAISKQELLSRNLPLTYQFGKIRAYSEFEDADIIKLIDYVHAKGKRVMAVGFTEESFAIAARADGFVSCAPIHGRIAKGADEEIHQMELAGHQNSRSCTQTVKGKASCLVPRPSEGKGGLASLSLARTSARSAARNLSDFLRYMVSTQIMRLFAVTVPMFLGKEALDARHIVLLGCVMDLFALLFFASKRQGEKRTSHKRYDRCESVGAFFVGDSVLLIASFCAVAALLILPELFALTGIAGLYHDKVEVSLIALVFLQISAMILIGLDGAQDRRLYRNKALVATVLCLVLFLLICFVWRDFGGLFGVESLPSLPYLGLALLPSALFFLLMLLLPKRRNDE